MKKYIHLIFSLLFFTAIRSQPFILSGHSVGKSYGLIVLNYIDTNFKEISDTVSIIDGYFKFKGVVKGAQLAYLNNVVNADTAFGIYDRYMFIKPGLISLIFTYGDLENGVVSGSSVQREADSWKMQKAVFLNKLQPLRSSIDSVKKLLKENKLEPNNADSQIILLNRKSVILYDSIRMMDVNYVMDNTDSYLSINLLKYLIGSLPNDSIANLYSLLKENITNSSEGFSFNTVFNNYKTALTKIYPFAAININKPAPDFALYDTKDTMYLKDFLGKIILLEFWETTCFPCLISNPQIELLRKKYETRGLIVIGITTENRSQTAALNKYINNNKLHKWLHVHESKKELNPTLWRGDFSRYYNIEVPRTVLIDGKGILVYKALGYQIDDISKLEAAIISSLNIEEEALTSD